MQRFRGAASRPPRGPVQLSPIAARIDDVANDADVVTVGVFVYRGVTSSEVDEPVTKLADRLNARIVLVGAELGGVHAVEPPRSITISHTWASAPPIDVLVVPGGLGWRQVIDDDEAREWLRAAAHAARGVLAMSTGSLLLASVGRLAGREATGHWLAERELAELGAAVTSNRTASDDNGRVVTASGALAALAIVDDLADHARWAEWMPDGVSAGAPSVPVSVDGAATGRQVLRR